MRIIYTLLLASIAIFSFPAFTNQTVSFENHQLSPFVNKGPFNFETIAEGGTPSPNTGPLTGANGTRGYVFVEASTGGAFNAGDTAILQADGIEADSIEFYYHMFGEHIGKLELQAVKNGIWETVTQIEGQQQASHSAAWKVHSASLSGFPMPTNIRFVVTAKGDYKGDIALDQVKFIQTPTLPSLIKADFENSLGFFTNTTPFLVSRYQGYTPTASTGPSSGANGTATYAFLETSTGAADSAGDTGILQANVSGSRLSFYFHMYGSHAGTIAVEALINGTWRQVWQQSGQVQTSSTDPWHKVYLNLSHYTAIRFKLVSAGGYLGDIAIDEIAFNPPELQDLSTSLEGGIDWQNEGNYMWLRQQGVAPTSYTGPSGAKEGNYYALFETSYGAAYNQGNSAILKSPRLLGNERVICYWFHMYGADVGALALQSSPNDSQWVTLMEFNRQQHSSESSKWSNVCAAIPSGTRYLRFLATANGGYRGDIAIDAIRIDSQASSAVEFASDTVQYYNGDPIQFNFTVDGPSSSYTVQYMETGGNWSNAQRTAGNSWRFNLSGNTNPAYVKVKVVFADGSVFYRTIHIQLENLGDKQPNKTIFIHTDLLGNPVAESQ
ncbi:hypothetical protein [Pseudoalteromonas sp. T1lg23B]|uniref:hypothetical protein n=1 Tax=Pseudoalteromonas sp. T1lg23B TaxID=2077097 RepID=UPI000CF63A4A|nr:hypothetical protein [Pseudoalteromonas sp. T1lg23B]